MKTHGLQIKRQKVKVIPCAPRWQGLLSFYELGTSRSLNKETTVNNSIVSTFVVILAKPYRSQPRGRYPAMIDADGTVRVWDAVAGHYTTCHSLSPRSQARIRAAALRGES